MSASLPIPLAKQPASIWPGGRPPAYARRRPELSTLHKVVRENLATLYAATEAGFDGTPLPRFVRQELDGYVGCGSLNRGFAHLRCEGCSDSRLVAFSCHGRGFCPSCFGRRMAQTSANLLDHVLPANVPLRQWVVTLPHALRARIAYDGVLLGAVVRLFADTVLGWYRRRMQIAGAPGGRGGGITVVQRVSSDLRCNPHVHGIFVDGVFVPAADGGKPTFHALPHLSDTAVADVLQISRTRILKFLIRRGVVDVADDMVTVTDDLADRDPVLAALASASVYGLPPAGPARRKPTLIALRGHGGHAEPTIKSPLCVDHAGFGLHAATVARADDARGRQALVKYVLRPPVANERLQITPDGNVRLLLKKAFRDGTAAIEMQPLALLTRLATAVPPPKRHVVGYFGVLSSASRLRPLVVPPLPASAEAAAHPPPHAPPPSAEPDGRKPTHRCRYRPLLELLRRTFGDDLAACQRCGGRMRLVALVQDQQSIDRFLRGIGESTDFPSLAPARGPPYFTVQGSRGAKNAAPLAPEPIDESP